MTCASEHASTCALTRVFGLCAGMCARMCVDMRADMGRYMWVEVCADIFVF